MPPFSIEEFRSVQDDCTQKLSHHILQLHHAMCEANELHREQLKTLRHLMRPSYLQDGSGAIWLGEDAPAQDQTNTNKLTKLGEESASEPLVVQREDSFPFPSTNALGESQKPQKPCLIASDFGMPEHFPNVQSVPQTVLMEHPRSSARSKLRKDATQRIQVDLPLRIQPGRILTWATGFSGQPKLLSYNFDALQAFAAIPLIFNRGSIFMLRRSLLVQLFCQPFFIGVVCVILRAVWPEDVSFKKSSLFEGLTLLTEQLSGLAPFLLGLFTTLMLRRWWTVRAQYLHKFHVSCSELSLKLGIILPNATEKVKLKIERYLLASHKLIYLCSRQYTTHLTCLKTDQYQYAYDGLVSEGLLTEDELKYIQSRIVQTPASVQGKIGSFDLAVAIIPVTWACHLIVRLFKLNYSAGPLKNKLDLPVPVMTQMINLCGNMRSSIQDMEMMINSQLPFSYIHAVVLIVHCLAIFSCLRAAVHLAATEFHLSDFVAQSCCVVAMNALYSGLLCLAAVLSDPFGDECVDFPAANLQCRLYKSQIFARDLLFPNAIVDKDIFKMMVETNMLLEQSKKNNANDFDEEEEQQEECEDEADDGFD